MDKSLLYADLVKNRQACTVCMAARANPGIVNPSSCASYDVNEIGHWSRWQGNLNADILIVGQDWGDYAGFKKWEGKDSDTNPTNRNLKSLLETIGVQIGNPTKYDGRSGKIFLTNAILCLKDSSAGMQAKIKREWVENCGQAFLKPLIDLIKPRIVISLGSWAYLSMQKLYGLERKSFQRRIADYASYNFKPIRLPDQFYYFPMYHCGQRVVNSQGGLHKQILLWKNINPYYSCLPAKPQ